MSAHYDVIIVGGGLVGSAFACALAKQTTLKIAILETQRLPSSLLSSIYHHRVSAISLTSQRFFQAIEIWDTIKNHRISSFSGMVVWDSFGIEMHFDSKDITEKQLGFIIENNLIHHAILEKIKTISTIDWIDSTTLMALREKEDGIEVITSDQKKLNAKLIIAADGAKSWVREQAGIEIAKHDYQETALVANVKTALAHQCIARQVFLETGPLAFLPLSESNQSSIVWSVPTPEAKRLMTLDIENFKSELAAVFPHLGIIKHSSERHTFPLIKQQAKNYISSRMALLGDAAHCVHPLAGQGVNIGLLDAASLAKILVDEIKKGKDFSRFSVLRRYERDRKANNFAILTAIDVIKNLFSNDKKPLPFFRKAGLKAINQFSWMKKLFISSVN